MINLEKILNRKSTSPPPTPATPPFKKIYTILPPPFLIFQIFPSEEGNETILL